MLPGAWKKELGFTSLFHQLLRKVFSLEWSELMQEHFLFVSLAFATYSVTAGHCCRVALTVSFYDGQILLPACLF